MKKEIIVVGSIGNTARQNRDNMRVLNRGGADVCVEKSHHVRSSVGSQKNKKKIVVIGDISPENRHQWSIVFGRYGVSRNLQARDWKYPVCVVRKYETNCNYRGNG